MLKNHDYDATIDELKTYQHLMHESGLPILNKYCFDVIEHALSMMQKLEEPSEGMISAVCEVYCESDDTGAISTAKQGMKAMLEQAEKEIEG